MGYPVFFSPFNLSPSSQWQRLAVGSLSSRLIELLPQNPTGNFSKTCKYRFSAITICFYRTLLNSSIPKTNDNSTLSSAMNYPIPGTPMSVLITTYGPPPPPRDTLMLLITVLYTAIIVLYPHGDVQFQKGEIQHFQYNSLELMVEDSNLPRTGLTYFKVGGIAHGLGQFLQQYGYWYLTFEIYEDGVGWIGRGRLRNAPSLPTAQVASLATS